MKSIKTEAYRNANLSTNVDHFRFKYRDVENNVEVIFPSPLIDAFEKNIFDVLSNCDKVEWKSSWSQRPDYVSSEFYGSSIYWPLILYVNRLSSIEDFNNLESVLIPSFSSILKISRDKIPEDQIEPMPTVSRISANAKYYKKYPLDESEKKRIESNKALQDNTNDDSVVDDTTAPLYVEIEEDIVLTQEMIDNEYMLLEYQPTNASTISLFIDGTSEPMKYSYDYILLQDASSREWIKLSWKNRDCPFGLGLSEILNEVGIEMKIIYVTGGGLGGVANIIGIDGGIYGADEWDGLSVEGGEEF